VRALLIGALTLKLHHHFHGPAIDYVGLALAASLSWIGIPGPGEPILIAASVFAAKHKLDITSVLVAAWIGATVGGIGGWLIGLKAGRRLVTARGPLHTMRLHAVERGERVFERYTLLAILLTPTWVAGIHRVATGRFLLINAIAAAMWACGLGLGAYFIGPTVVDLLDEVGIAAGVVVGLVIVGIVVAEIIRRRHHRAATPDDAG
jgi:membrane protein DedA with SNARE-associated domain